MFGWWRENNRLKLGLPIAWSDKLYYEKKKFVTTLRICLNNNGALFFFFVFEENNNRADKYKNSWSPNKNDK